MLILNRLPSFDDQASVVGMFSLSLVVSEQYYEYLLKVGYFSRLGMSCSLADCDFGLVPAEVAVFHFQV